MFISGMYLSTWEGEIMYSFIGTKTVCGPNMLFYQIKFKKRGCFFIFKEGHKDH